jgi:hypothetical protein
MQKVFFDAVTFMAKAEDEFLMAKMRVVLHQMPKNGARPDLHHGLRDVIDVTSKPHAGSATEDHNFHSLPLAQLFNIRADLLPWPAIYKHPMHQNATP